MKKKHKSEEKNTTEKRTKVKGQWMASWKMSDSAEAKERGKIDRRMDKSTIAVTIGSATTFLLSIAMIYNCIGFSLETRLLF